jgi:hypothetical protein
MELFMAIAANMFDSDIISEGHAGFGVDIQAPIVTPTTKFFGVDDGAHDGMSLGNQAFLTSFGFLEPDFVAHTGELIPVGHDADCGVILIGQIPSHANGLNGFSHE